jgi:hypothetical protein
VNLEARLNSVLDEVIPDHETARALDLEYPWLTRDAGIGTWSNEMYAEISALISQGSVVPRQLVEIIDEFNAAAIPA